MFKYLSVIVLLILLPSCGGASTPLKDLVSYEEFQRIIKYNAGRVPELHSLWKNKLGQSVFWGGGTFRGFLHWHYMMLQTHSVGELKTLPVPNLIDFQKYGGHRNYDLDFFGPSESEEFVKNTLSASTKIDFLSLEVLKEFVGLGGATLEKSGINPHEILDPTDGVKHYYEGLLVFSDISKGFLKKNYLKNVYNYSKIAEALRFLRFAYFNFPELAPTPQSLLIIKNIPYAERDYIYSEESLAWLEISLEKLIRAANNDFLKVLNILFENNLLVYLVEKNLRLPESFEPPITQWFLENMGLFSKKEQRKLKKYFLGVSQCEKVLSVF